MTTARRPSSDEPHVEFENIGKSYDGRVMAVQDFSLTVRRGEFLSLLGPSGSGKTTCLMMLAGFEVPTTGAIRIAGRSVHALPPRKRGIGMVFQDYALFPHMTVAENLAFPLDVRGMSRDETTDLVRRACSWSAWKALMDVGPASFPVDSNSAWPSPGRWYSNPTWCSWTNHWAHSTGTCARRCSTRFAASIGPSA